MNVLWRDETGSVFIETVVALALLAAVLAGTFQVLADSAARRHEIAARREALMVARSALETVGSATPYRFGATDGVDGQIMWRIQMQPCSTDRSGAGALYCVTVSAGDARGGPPLVTLQTRRLAPRV